MINKIILQDILLDEESLGLAESFIPVGCPFTTTISSDEKAAPGDIIYFGVALSIGDIVEVKGKISSCHKQEDKPYIIDIEVQALDSRYAELLTRVLKGEAEYELTERLLRIRAAGSLNASSSSTPGMCSPLPHGNFIQPPRPDPIDPFTQSISYPDI
jgi:hypothetical protein